jgi:hypothetical protein
MTNVTKLKEPTVLDPPQLLQQAIASGASIETLDRLLTMQERFEANQARKAFNAAIAAFKADPPAILKNVAVSFGNTNYKHEDLAELLAVVDPALAKHGLWVRFKIHSGPDLVTVTCVLGHVDGYSEADNTLSSKPDTSGAKNPIQAIGSAVSYLQRYTLKAALGLAAAKDDDGKASGRRGDVLSPQQVDEINEMLLANPKINVDKFLQLAGAPSVSDIMAVKFDSALRYLKNRASKK